MGLSLAEQETIVRFDRESDMMILDTFSASQMRKLVHQGATVRHAWKRGGQEAWTLEMPKRWFRWPKKPSEARARIGRERQKALVQPRNPDPTA